MTETKNDRGEEGTDRGLRLIPQVASCIIYIYIKFTWLGFWILVDLSRSLYSFYIFNFLEVASLDYHKGLRRCL